LNSNVVGDNYIDFLGWRERSKLKSRWKRNRDVIGNYPLPNPFHLTRVTSTPLILNGERFLGDPPVLSRAFKDCPIDFVISGDGPNAVFPKFNPVELGNHALGAVADTNPNLPHISVPTAIGELKDVPGLLKGWGDGILKAIANGYLSWRWGIKPMVRDLTALLDFHDAVNSRIKELERLKGDRYIRKRVGLGSTTETTLATSPTFLETELGLSAYLRGYKRVVYTQKAWATVQWNVDSGYVFPKTADGMADLARQLVLGMTSHEALATAWELFPWSWAVDWFFGIGDVINAGNNTIPLTFSNVCIMQTTSAKTEYVRIGTHPEDSTWIYFSGEFSYQHEELRRFPSVFVPPVAFPTILPFLDKGKWSILGALAVLRT
jgi:hypothetical protein